MFRMISMIASVARNISGITSRRLALSSSVRSKYCTEWVSFALGSSDNTKRASELIRSDRIGLRL